ncbi:hypothetical protein SAMN05444375_10738 [Segatella baroniae B14]|jgi:hypothetical protein|nr:hypothetical protein SAMN04487899_104218 [Segatella bryantii]SEQ25509.1 hypothetical protein SAMN05444375_10738 [Segatella baroniae B14]
MILIACFCNYNNLMAILLEVDHIQFVLSRRLYFEKTVLLKFALFVKCLSLHNIRSD